MKYLKLIILQMVLLLLMAGTGSAAGKTDVMAVGEELTYDVTFMGTRIGTIKIATQGKEKIGNKTCYKVKAWVDSDKKIPYVFLHFVGESWIDPSVSYSHKFISTSKTKGSGDEVQSIVFDYNLNRITNTKTVGGNVDAYNSFDINQKYNDGLSLFFLARKFITMKRTVHIPTFMNVDTAMTVISFFGKKENVEIDAVSKSIKTIYFSGDGRWSGLSGLSGSFEGWFSDDAAHVPIKAKMNILIGSINIELKSWKRSGWTPPTAG